LPNEPDRPSIIPILIGSGAACALAIINPDNSAQALRTLRRISTFKALENKNAAPNSAAWLLHGAAAKTKCDCRSPTMFVLPLSRPSSRAAFGRVVDDSFDRFFRNAVVAETSRTPALDVSETDGAYIVAFDVPGVTREQLKVSVEGRRLSIETVDLAQPAAAEGAAEAPKADAAPRSLYRERSTARYARTVSLPTEVDQTASSAKFENGVLTLTLAKKVKAGAVQIAIN
jgi:HSP20 family protein